MNKKNLLNVLMVALVVVYWVAPDLIPGPIDDAFVTILTMVASSKLDEIKQRRYIEEADQKA